MQMWIQSPGREDPLEREWQPTPVFLPEEFHEQRSLADYSPWLTKSLSQLSDQHFAGTYPILP